MAGPSADFSHLKGDIARLIVAEHGDPFSVLGMHTEPGGQGFSVRVFHPDARAISVAIGRRNIGLDQLEPGFFAGLVAPPGKRSPYLLRIETSETLIACDDPYRFGLIVNAEDAINLKAGRCWHAHRVLGAQALTLEGIAGISFAVWAPTAQRVSVVGDWNGWDARRRPMRFRHEIGVWEIFEPGLAPDAAYAFEILTKAGQTLRKRDPYARALSPAAAGAARLTPPLTAQWTDAAWIARGRAHAAAQPFAALYQVSSADLGQKPNAAETLLGRIQRRGGTHLVLMQAWTPQTHDAATARPKGWLASNDAWGGEAGLRRLIDQAHARGLGVLIDWPIDAFGDDQEGLIQFDGSALYEHSDPARAKASDEASRRFNYVRYEAANFLLSAALFWLEDMHADGLALRGLGEALRFRATEGDRALVDVAGVDYVRRLTELVAARAQGGVVLGDACCDWPGGTAPTWAGGLGCSRLAAPYWAGWLGQGAPTMLALLALSAQAGLLAFDAWQPESEAAKPGDEAGLAALIMALLPGWKLWPSATLGARPAQQALSALIGALNQAQPQGGVDLLAHPGVDQGLLAFTRGQSLLCAANFSRTQAHALCPAPGAGEYEILARSGVFPGKARARVTAHAAPNAASGWMLHLDLPPRGAVAAQRIG